MSNNNERRYQVRFSDKHYGKYVVYDIVKEEIHRFHNLSSARIWADEQNKNSSNDTKTEKDEYCELCECTPCDCNWGTD